VLVVSSSSQFSYKGNKTSVKHKINLFIFALPSAKTLSPKRPRYKNERKKKLLFLSTLSTLSTSIFLMLEILMVDGSV